MEAVVLVNPAAAAGRARRLVDPVVRTLREAGYDARPRWVTTRDEARSAAAAVDPDTLLVPVGGDGHLGAAVAGAVESGACVLPLPGGSGNDFVRSLGYPMSPLPALEHGLAATERRADVGRHAGGIFAAACEIGLDGYAGAIGHRLGVIRGRARYGLGALAAIATAGPIPMRVVLDDEVLMGRFWLVGVVNGGYVGGGMRMNPRARIDDGFLDVTVLHDRPRSELPGLFAHLLRGTHEGLPGLDQRQVRHVQVVADRSAHLSIDGDPHRSATMSVDVVPAAVRLRV